MSAMRPELRTPVMTLVDLSWQDAAGALQTRRARMEDKSVGGACLRVNSPFLVGAKLRIQWRFEQFSGTVRYCRSDGHDYLLGIQRDNEKASMALPPVAEKPGSQPAGTTAQPLSNPQNSQSQKSETQESESRESESRSVETPQSLRRSGEKSSLTGELRRPSQPWETRANPIPPGPPAGVVTRAKASVVSAPRLGISKVAETADASPRLARARTGGDAPPSAELFPKIASSPTGGGKERKPMASKWLGLAAWRKKKDHLENKQKSNAGAQNTKENSMAHEISPKENSTHAAREVPAFQVELLAAEDVYQSAGILEPRRGYSAVKIVEMLESKHLQGASPEMKRAAVLMALDAAGVSIEQIQRDAKLRHDALDAYELAQKKQAEVEWARKAEEIVLIRSELESLKAHYTARIERGMEAVARDKARFDEWSTKKDLEAKSMAEALELCTKPPMPESRTSESKTSESKSSESKSSETKTTQTEDAAASLASAATAAGSGSD